MAGLAALGTVVAQQPTGGGAPTGGVPATPVTRPYSDWTPTPPAPGYTPTQPGGVRPAGGSYLPPPAGAAAQPPGSTPVGGVPRLNTPAGGGQVTPVGALNLPPPSMDFPVTTAGGTTGSMAVPPPAGTTGAQLPPPSVSVDPRDNKPVPTPTLPEPPGFVPVPPPAGVTPPPLPALPSTPVAPPAAIPPTPKPFPVPPVPSVGGGAPLIPPAPPGGLVVPQSTQGLPNKVNQAVSVEALCPDTVVYGAECRYELVVRNTGNVAVQNVRLEDEIPPGCKYVGSDPPGELNGDKLVWSLGLVDGNTEKRIAVRVRPNEEGELRSRATVTFSSSVDMKARVTRPRITVTGTCQEVCKVGEDAVFQIKVTNSGTGPAQNMTLRAEMSDGLFFSQGPKLETKLANLAAGETKPVTLRLSAAKAGLQKCQFTVTADGSADSTASAAVNVVEPLLQITQTGPAKCLVRAEPTYEVTLSNPGTAATDPVTLYAVLPDGFEFVQASDTGAFNATNRAVSWKLPGLPAGGTKAVAVKLRAAAAGDAVLRTVAYSAPEAAITPAGVGAAKPIGRVIEAKAETTVKAEGVPALRFDVRGLENPVEVGKDAVYEIRVTNQGTGACTNVQLMAAMAQDTTFSGASPATVKAQGQTLVFESIPNLPVKGEMVYTVRVRSTADGDHRFRVQLTCDQVRTPVQKEESTSFYKQ